MRLLYHLFTSEQLFRSLRQAARQQIYSRLIAETENLQRKVIDLIDLLAEDFERSFSQKHSSKTEFVSKQ